MAARGLPTVMPLWNFGSSEQIGLKIVPGTAPTSWPAVFVNELGIASTLARDATLLVPTMLFLFTLKRFDVTPEADDLARSLDQALSVHRLLGGNEASLRHVAEAATSFAPSEALVALDERSEHQRAWQAFQAAAFLVRQVTEEPPKAVLRAANVFVEQHGWDDVCWIASRWQD